MFVKTLSPSGDSWSIFDVGDDVNIGTHVIADGRTELGDPKWSDEIDGIAPSSRIVSSVTSGPWSDPESGEPPTWVIAWAAWYDRDDRHQAVVTSGPIYVMSSAGATIDRVGAA